METTLGLEIIEVVEQAAIASARWMGKGEKDIADEVANRALVRDLFGQLEVLQRQMKDDLDLSSLRPE